METLRYQTWQKRSALGRLLLGGVGLGLLFWFGFEFVHEGDFFWGLFFIALAVLGGLYLWRTGVEPLRRAGLEVVLEPEGVRVGGRFYPRSTFRGVVGPRGRWAARLAAHGKDPEVALLRRARSRGSPFDPGPLFHLDFAGERVPLWLDLPGWDRMLRHLGLDWTEHPGLSGYLGLVEGLGWLNGLLYPPEEAKEAWLQARMRYRRLAGLVWLGYTPVAVTFLFAFLGVEPRGVWEWVLTGFILGGFVFALYAMWELFGSRTRLGWGMRYNPLRKEAD
ncbi:hypothetical protein DV704_08645 [Meiothermus sp. QL-1]|uniref:hypothetical protein n=1 Tax=Meiothermus sp. QL-1 TaxID=2058095 RepID=UPI000E0CBDAB|nr:hypothetical protein [Meiothermus sp. QL-1]RDI95131.1 hypothetical protein DV704_08645 [Meiothermus sp. QL-1]